MTTKSANQLLGNRDPLVGRPATEAIPELLDRAGNKIFGLGLKICGDRADAEDLVQETFFQAFRKWASFEGRSDPSSWLYTIAVRACQRRNRRRSEEPRRLESLDELLPSGDASAVPVPSPLEGPFDEQVRRETAEVVDRALVALPLKYRLPLVLKELGELSLQEISEILDLKEATVKTRLHRARLALRNELTASLPRGKRSGDRHARQICLDLLQAKMESLDRGVPFPVPREQLCSRCRSVFDSLDLTVEGCRWLEGGELSQGLRERLRAEFSRE